MSSSVKSKEDSLTPHSDENTSSKSMSQSQDFTPEKLVANESETQLSMHVLDSVSTDDHQDSKVSNYTPEMPPDASYPNPLENSLDHMPTSEPLPVTLQPDEQSIQISTEISPSHYTNDNAANDGNTLTQLIESSVNTDKRSIEVNSDKEPSNDFNMQELADSLNSPIEINKNSYVASSSSPEPNDKSYTVNTTTNLDESENSIYHIKWIKFNNQTRAIITQNQNGPCPMIAIANVLLLRGTIDLPKDSELISGNRLLAMLSELLLSKTPDDLDDGQLINYESNFYDALCLFPNLQTGLDVNIRFTGVSDFEYTSTLSLFDLFNIHIYHGWLVDPDEHDLAVTVGKRTYNQLTEELLRLRSSDNSEDLYRSTLVEWFLNQSGSQLTFHGLSQLVSTLRDEELAVFFRNNHFSTILKHKDSIFMLVTDMGLLNEPKIVWELLNDLDGDTQFVDCCFQLFCPSTPSPDEEAGTDAVRIITIRSDKTNPKYNNSTDDNKNNRANNNNNKDDFVEKQYYPDSLTSGHANLSDSNNTSLDYELCKMLQEEEIKASNQNPEKFWKLYK
ncbi:unnamed protein product [Trichobilharzia szidati]|nr:unnamed protein product [Trichobilharzia szidati]